MPSLIPVIMCDVDGTLADDSYRISQRPTYDRAEFDLASIDDPPIPYMVETVRQLARSYDIIIMTGRLDVAAEVTAEWLDRYNIPWEELLMRRLEDEQPNHVLKVAMYEEVIGPMQRQVELVIDNSSQAISALTDRGVNTLHVNRPPSPLDGEG